MQVKQTIEMHIITIIVVVITIIVINIIIIIIMTESRVHLCLQKRQLAEDTVELSSINTGLPNSACIHLNATEYVHDPVPDRCVMS